jgi:hypothetical protein
MAIRNGGDDTRIETPTATDQATYLFTYGFCRAMKIDF